MLFKESSEEYGQRRANETREPYLMTNMGHVFWYVPDNIRSAEKDCLGIAKIFYPKPREGLEHAATHSN